MGLFAALRLERTMMTLTTRQRWATGAALFAVLGATLAACAAPGTTPTEEPDDTAPAWTAEFSQDAADLLPTSVTDAGVLRFGGEAGRAPFRFVNESGEIDGIERDMGEAIGIILGVEVQYDEVAGLAPTLLALSSERIDVAFGPFLPNPDRQKDYDYVNFMLNTQSILTLSDDDSVEELPSDLCGREVSLLENSPSAGYLTAASEACVAAGEEAIVQAPVATQEALILGLLSGRSEVAASASPVANYAAEQNPELRSLQDEARLNTLGSLTSKLRPELGEALFAAFEELYSSGAYDAIMAKWGQEEATIDEPSRLD